MAVVAGLPGMRGFDWIPLLPTAERAVLDLPPNFEADYPTYPLVTFEAKTLEGFEKFFELAFVMS